MRIIAGANKGHSIKAVPGTQTRPTTDRVREAWASTVQHLMPGEGLDNSRILDAFAGSGALGLELLSRGAAHCLFIENDRVASRVLQENIAGLRLPHEMALVCKANSLNQQLPRRVQEAKPFNLVILDPPYALSPDAVADLLSRLSKAGLLVQECLISYEHASATRLNWDGACLPREIGSNDTSEQQTTVLHLAQHKEYGTICIDYFYASHEEA